MDAQEAEAAYHITKSQLDAGQINLEDYTKRSLSSGTLTTPEHGGQ